MPNELMTEDCLEHAVAPFGQAEPGRVNGPAAMRETAGWLLAQFPDLHMTSHCSESRAAGWPSIGPPVRTWW